MDSACVNSLCVHETRVEFTVGGKAGGVGYTAADTDDAGAVIVSDSLSANSASVGVGLW